MLRLADQETLQPHKSYATVIQTASVLVSQHDWAELFEVLTQLQEQFPLHIPELVVTEESIKSALDLHNKLCAACHDNPALNIQRPAYNLYQQATTESDTEFFARMLVGVRGDRVTGIDNPLSDIQLMSLIKLYKTAKNSDLTQ